MGSQRVGQDLAIQLAGMVEEEDKISLDVRKVSRLLIYDTWTSLVVQMVKNLPAMQETWVIPGLGRSPGEGNGYPL